MKTQKSRAAASREALFQTAKPAEETAGAPPRSPLAAWLWRIAAFSVLAAAVLFAARQMGDNDTGFHLRAGDYILNGGGWPRTDPFSFGMSDHAYTDTSWGFQVLAAALYRLAGVAGPIALTAVLAVAMFGFALLAARLRAGNAAWGPLLLLASVVAVEIRLEIRPEMLSYALFSAELFLLHRYRQTGRLKWWVLPAIHLLWANCHALYPVGLAAQGAFFLGGWLETRRPDWRLAKIAAGSFAMGVINPYGFKGLFFPIELLTRFSSGNIFAREIAELEANPFKLNLTDRFPFYPMASVWTFRLLVLLMIPAAWTLIRKRQWTHMLLALLYLPLAFRMIRNIPLVVIAILPMLFLASADWMENPPRQLAGWRARLDMAPSILAIALALAIAPLIINDAWYVVDRRGERFGLSENRNKLPVDAARFLRERHGQGRIFNHINHGGYLMWAVPEMPHLIDGRLELAGERFFEEYLTCLSRLDLLEGCMRRHGTRVFVHSTLLIHPLMVKELLASPRWRLDYADHAALVFSFHPDAAAGAPPHAHEPLLRLRQVEKPPRPWPGFDGSPRPRAGLNFWLQAWTEQVRFPNGDYALGLFCMYAGESAAAEALNLRAIVSSGGAFYEVYNNLGALWWRQGRLREAAQAYQAVLQDVPDHKIALQRVQGMGK
ncbi:MAG: hypothetical protein GMKNLPBB_02846 [Myxococcota bacterium]|nr:hypothetical protein [Myxococcota bacterium]